MSGRARERPSLSAREGLALACFLVWFVGALLSRLIGLWLASGGVAILLGLVVAGSARRSTWRRLKPTGRDLGWGLGAGVVMTAATYLLFPPIHHLIPSVLHETAALYATFGDPTGWRARVLLPLVIAGEELVWRGAIQQALIQRFGGRAAIAGTTVLYGLAVAPVGSPLLVVIALACGLYWSLLRGLTGSLVPPLLAHLVWDAVVFLFRPLA